MITDNYGLLSELNDLNDSKVFEYLTDKLNEIKTQLMHCQEESTFRTLQGKSLMLFEIISNIESARDKMIEHRRYKPSMSQSF